MQNVILRLTKNDGIKVQFITHLFRIRNVREGNVFTAVCLIVSLSVHRRGARVIDHVRSCSNLFTWGPLHPPGPVVKRVVDFQLKRPSSSLNIFISYRTTVSINP